MVGNHTNIHLKRNLGVLARHRQDKQRHIQPLLKTHPSVVKLAFVFQLNTEIKETEADLRRDVFQFIGFYLKK